MHKLEILKFLTFLLVTASATTRPTQSTSSNTSKLVKRELATGLEDVSDNKIWRNLQSVLHASTSLRSFVYFEYTHISIPIMTVAIVGSYDVCNHCIIMMCGG